MGRTALPPRQDVIDDSAIVSVGANGTRYGCSEIIMLERFFLIDMHCLNLGQLDHAHFDLLQKHLHRTVTRASISARTRKELGMWKLSDRG